LATYRKVICFLPRPTQLFRETRRSKSSAKVRTRGKLAADSSRGLSGPAVVVPPCSATHFPCQRRGLSVAEWEQETTRQPLLVAGSVPDGYPGGVLAPPSLLEEINSVFLSDYLKDASQINGRVGCGPCSLDLPPFWPANHSYNSAACI